MDWSKWHAYVLAGGRGTRMGASENTPKPMVQVRGRPIYRYILDKLFRLGLAVSVLTGYGAHALETSIDAQYRQEKYNYYQDRPNPTWEDGEEVKEVKGTAVTFINLIDELRKPSTDEYILVTNADDIYPNTRFLEAIAEEHLKLVDGKAADATVLTVNMKNGGALGRVIRGKNGNFLEVIENGKLRDISDAIYVGKWSEHVRRRMTKKEVDDIREINTNVMVFNRRALLDVLEQKLAEIKRGEVEHNEIKIAELLADLVQRGKTVRVATVSSEDSFISCNDRDKDLPVAEKAVEGWDLDEIHDMVTAAQGNTDGLVDNGTKILLSESLFGGDAEVIRRQLKPLIEKGQIAILKPDELHDEVNKDRNSTKSNYTVVLTKDDFNNPETWTGRERDNLKASMLIIDDNFADNNYLYLEGVIGLARAIMAKNDIAIRAYYELISGKPISEEAISMLQEDKSIEFALAAILTFNPIVKMDSHETVMRKVYMEKFLTSA